MEEVVKRDILSVLRESLPMIKSNDSAGLNELSNHTIHNASIFQDDDSVTVAVLIYSLSKMIERTRIDSTKISELLSTAVGALQANQFGRFRLALKKLIEIISRLDSKLKLYIGEVINQAQIKKGSNLYRHGVSMARAAAVLGISQWELMNYVGKTSIDEDFPEPNDIGSRLKLARRLFNI